MQKFIITELNYSNDMQAFITYTIDGSPYFAPVRLFEVDGAFAFNFDKQSVHFERLKRNEGMEMVVGNVYANKFARFSYTIKISEATENKELADEIWREEVSWMFKGDEHSTDRVLCEVQIKTCFMYDEKGRLAESVEF